MHFYLRKAFDSTADGSAVTSHNTSIHQRLSKLGRAAHVFLLVGLGFEFQAFRRGWEGNQGKKVAEIRNELYELKHAAQMFKKNNKNATLPLQI